MTQTSPITPPSTNGELVIEPRFTGRTYVAVLRVLVRGESALVSKIDLAKDGARDTFVKTLVQRLPTGIDVDFKKSGKRLVFLGRKTDGADGMGETQTTYGPGDKGLFDKDLQNAPDGMDGMDGVLHPFSEDGTDESDEVEL